MRRLFSLPIVFILCAASPLRVGDVQIDYFTVTPQSYTLVLTWSSRVESGVSHYEIHRRTPYSRGEFVNLMAEPQLQPIAPHGPGKEYRFVDDTLSKADADQVEYRLIVAYENGDRKALSQQAINYTTTAIRRTWGSLKAMFQ